MPQSVKITVSYNIASPPPPPLVASPDTASLSAVAGVDIGTVAESQVTGGTPPYAQPVVDPSSPNPIPSGLSFAIDANGAVSASGTPQTAGSGTVVLMVSDSGA